MHEGGGGPDTGGTARAQGPAAALPSRRQVLAALAGAAGLTMVPVVAGRVLLPEADAAAVVDVRVDLDREAGRVPPRAMGFSFEKSTIPTPLFSPANGALVALFRLLGPGVLRLGGNSVDRVTFDPHGAGGTPGVVAPPDLDRLAAFAEAVDWQIIYGTPFLFATADEVRDEAVAATSALGARLEHLELCNEPDLYVLNPVAKAIAGSPGLFHPRWQAFADAIRGALPAAALCAPSTAFITVAKTFTKGFASLHPGSFSLLTQHYYRGFGFGSQTIDVLLGPDPQLEAGLDVLRTTAAASGVPYRLAETNSFASGGQPGVSNTFASALWGADLCLKAGEHDAAGVNIHNSGAGAGYPAIVTVGGVVTQIRPLFHGLLLAVAAGTGPMPPLQVTGAPPTLRIHAVQPRGTELRVVLVNAGTDDATVDLDADRAVGAASVRRLTGPELAATSGVTFGSAAVTVDGAWDPVAPEPLATAGSHVVVAVPATSAAVVTMAVAPPPPTTTTTTGTSTTTTGAAAGDAANVPTAAAAHPVTAAPALAG